MFGALPKKPGALRGPHYRKLLASVIGPKRGDFISSVLWDEQRRERSMKKLVFSLMLAVAVIGGAATAFAIAGNPAYAGGTSSTG